MTIEINGKVTTIAQLNGIINSDTDIDGAVSLGGTIIGASLSERGLKGERGAKGDKGDTGDTGATGNGIASVTYVSSSGLVDTYKITFTNGTETTFDVTNGEDGTDNYESLVNKPQIEGVTLIGNKSFSDLSLNALTNIEIEEILEGSE